MQAVRRLLRCDARAAERKRFGWRRCRCGWDNLGKRRIYVNYKMTDVADDENCAVFSEGLGEISWMVSWAKRRL